jgi:hypothetical protein
MRGMLIICGVVASGSALLFPCAALAQGVPPAPIPPPVIAPPLIPTPLPKTPPPVPVSELHKVAVKNLSHAIPAMRSQAIFTCGDRRIGECIFTLTSILATEENPELRAAAATALGKIADKRTIPHLTATSWRDDNDLVRAGARVALSAMGQTVRPGPYWEWDEYKVIKTEQRSWLTVLIVTTGIGLVTSAGGVISGFACTFESWTNDCGPSWDAAVAGAVISGMSGLGILVSLLISDSALDEVIPPQATPLAHPRPNLIIGPGGGRLDLTWRF